MSMQTCDTCKYIYFRQPDEREKDQGYSGPACCGKFFYMIAKFNFSQFVCISKEKVVLKNEPNFCGYYKKK